MSHHSETELSAAIVEAVDQAVSLRCAEHEKEMLALQHRHHQQLNGQRKVWQSFVEEAIKANQSQLHAHSAVIEKWADEVVAAKLCQHGQVLQAMIDKVQLDSEKDEAVADALVALRDELDKHWRAISALQCVD